MRPVWISQTRASLSTSLLHSIWRLDIWGIAADTFRFMTINYACSQTCVPDGPLMAHGIGTVSITFVLLCAKYLLSSALVSVSLRNNFFVYFPRTVDWISEQNINSFLHNEILLPFFCYTSSVYLICSNVIHILVSYRLLLSLLTEVFPHG